MASKRGREEACDLCGHYHDYEGGEPCSVCGHRLEAKQDVVHSAPRTAPSAILANWLYLGSFDVASRCEMLKMLGISHVLNTVPTSSNLYTTSFTYHTVSSTPPDFEECNKFLDTVQAEGHKVLVHCMTGASRSPSVVVAYLMHLRGWDLAAAARWVRDVHPAIALTAGDEMRLKHYDKQRTANKAAEQGASMGGSSLPPSAWGTSAAAGPGQQQFGQGWGPRLGPGPQQQQGPKIAFSGNGAGFVFGTQ